MVKLEELPWEQAPKMLANNRTEQMDVIAEDTCTDRAKNLARIAQLEGNLNGIMSKLDVLERLNNAADLRYSLLVDNCVRSLGVKRLEK